MTYVARISTFVQSVLTATKDVLKMYLYLFNASMKGDKDFHLKLPHSLMSSVKEELGGGIESSWTQ